MVRDVLVRFEGLVTRLETQFVRTDVFDYYKQLVETDIKRLNIAADRAADKEKFREIEVDMEKKVSKGELTALEKRILNLEDDKKWLVRVVISFIVVGVLTAIFAVAKVGGGA